MTTYKINYNDRMNIEISLSLYIKQLKKENEQLQKTMETNLKTIKNLRETELKTSGVYRSAEPPYIYDETLKGIFENIK